MRRVADMNEAVKNIEKLIVLKKKDQALKLLPIAYKTIDKALKGNTIKENTASRKKSRLSRQIAKIA